ncbi:nodulation receptor kinase [Amborella trichopoda]|uniref:nodulation receptor kinase n=1 Tax=Amborella trichopoda TaxID=13333 RepID=UPI0005D3BA27|nr:nodulation receptor kinase [Amborella trichopoda]XP_020530582.1 nodulation receptor kinase [Amborella trichopoda]|eukprot:XP_011627887.1 nodulation receptor kinase [Amborella trichopoda]
MAILGLVFLFALIGRLSAQPGFVSINCCAQTNITESATGINWTTDRGLQHERGVCFTLKSPPTAPFQYIRVFNADVGNRWCYSLKTLDNEAFLIRGSFVNGSSLLLYGLSVFNVSIDATVLSQVNAALDPTVVEAILRPGKNYVNFCLIEGVGDPFLSKLELRPVKVKGSWVENNKILKLMRRVDLGNMNFTVRFPDDPFDRIWAVDDLASDGGATVIYSPNATSGLEGIGAQVPTLVLASALSHPSHLQFILQSLEHGVNKYLVLLYFMELNPLVTRPGERVFHIFANGEKKFDSFDIFGNGSSNSSNYREVEFEMSAKGSLNISLVSASTEFGPICNGYEVYRVIDAVMGTSQKNVDVLAQARDQLLANNPHNNYTVLNKWSGDPCLPLSPNGQPVPWDGLDCEFQKGVFVVTTLDLASNSLQGRVPTILTELDELKKLNLSHNQLSGTIPEFPCSSMLTSVDIRYNEFTGAIPQSFTCLPHLSTLLLGCNPDLSSDLPAGLNPNVVTGSDGCDTQDEINGQAQRNTVFISSVAGGSVAFTVAIGIIFTCFYRRGFQRHRRKQIASVPSIPVSVDLVSKPIRIQPFSLETIEVTTCKYMTMIGEGGFGAVYHGNLNGQDIAVKVRSAISTQGTREFENELNFLSAIQHENLVPLLGYCCENDQQILVYPFMSNGSLQDRLYGDAAKRKPLDWPTRISIALGAARGLLYLHTFAARCIIHRDVKSSNILLDHSMSAKVADFGFSKYAPQEGDSGASLEVRGTAGYLDPEYYSTQQLTVKSDVFSFGVVLLEIISGREPLNIHRPRSEWSLVEWAKSLIKEGKIEDVVDPTIRSAYAGEAMWRMVEAALTCVETFGTYRPSMEYVVRELEDALIIENNASMYMRSIESFGSCRFPSLERKNSLSPPSATPSEPSPINAQALPLPVPR